MTNYKKLPSGAEWLKNGTAESLKKLNEMSA